MSKLQDECGQEHDAGQAPQGDGAGILLGAEELRCGRCGIRCRGLKIVDDQLDQYRRLGRNSAHRVELSSTARMAS